MGKNKKYKKNLRELRQQKKLTINSLSELARVSFSLIVCLEHNLPSLIAEDEIKRLSTALGCEEYEIDYK